LLAVIAFSGKFRAQSISSETPPFPISETAEVVVAIAVRAEDILEAARTIKPQVTPGYFVDGTLSCKVASQEATPYHVFSSCAVLIYGQVAVVLNPELIIAALKTVLPMVGPIYSFEGNFTASSISREVPPYGADEEAEVLLFK
jgi:hypothetical protein